VIRLQFIHLSVVASLISLRSTLCEGVLSDDDICRYVCLYVAISTHNYILIINDHFLLLAGHKRPTM